MAVGSTPFFDLIIGKYCSINDLIDLLSGLVFFCFFDYD